MKSLKLSRPAIFLIFCLFVLSCLNEKCFGVSGVPAHGGKDPWFTGPLLTPTARVISVGHINLEPYLFLTVNTGHYGDKWKAKSIPKFYQVNPQIQFKVGVIENFDFSISLQSYRSWTQGKVGSEFGDLPIGIDYQLYKGDDDSWLTYAKFAIQETFPIGKYDKLNPHNMGTDVGGAGTYATQIGFAFSKLVKFCDGRFMNTRCFIAATLSTPVQVHGLSVYGGARGTRGKVHPGTGYAFLAGTEYTVTKNWTLACDIQIVYAEKNRFKGRTFSPIGSVSSAQFSVAPAVEYNWNDSLGVIIGPWFTVAGRNSTQFYSLVAALNYVY